MTKTMAKIASKSNTTRPANNSGTPLFDRLKADLGDPVIRPAIDRSFATLSRMSEMERAKPVASTGQSKKAPAKASSAK